MVSNSTLYHIRTRQKQEVATIGMVPRIASEKQSEGSKPTQAKMQLGNRMAVLEHSGPVKVNQKVKFQHKHTLNNTAYNFQHTVTNFDTMIDQVHKIMENLGKVDLRVKIYLFQFTSNKAHKQHDTVGISYGGNL